jgi:hypothetical protein
LREVDRALAIANQHGENFQLSEMLRLKGDLLTTLPKSRLNEAKVCYQQALQVADRQGARLPKLRAAASLARLLARRRQPAQARAVLQPPYEAIGEGLELADVKAAASLLAELADA